MTPVVQLRLIDLGDFVRVERNVTPTHNCGSSYHNHSAMLNSPYMEFSLSNYWYSVILGVKPLGKGFTDNWYCLGKKHNYIIFFLPAILYASLVLWVILGFWLKNKLIVTAHAMSHLINVAYSFTQGHLHALLTHVEIHLLPVRGAATHFGPLGNSSTTALSC